MLAVGNEKRCSKCKETKKLDDFHKNRQQKDGLSGMCKTCRSKSKAILPLPGENERRCTACGHIKNKSEFWNHHKKEKSGVINYFASFCKACYKEKKKNNKASEQRRCPACGKLFNPTRAQLSDFTARNLKRMYCSNECNIKDKRKIIIGFNYWHCNFCGNLVKLSDNKKWAWVKLGQRKFFCNSHCYNEYQKIKQTPEWISAKNEALSFQSEVSNQPVY